MRIKKILTLLLTVVLLISCFAVGCKEDESSKYENTSNEIVNGIAKGDFKMVNHRGFNFVAPENTLSAFRLSDDEGFTHVECDIVFTKDGVPVLSHDTSIDRTCASGNTGEIKDLNYADIKDLDFSYDKTAYAGEKMPTFEQFLALCKELNLHAYLDIRAQSTKSETKILVDMVNSGGMQGQVSYISSSAHVLEAVKEKDETARLGFVCSYASDDKIAELRALRTGKNEIFMDCNYYYMTKTDKINTKEGLEQTIYNCKYFKIPLEVWTVNSEKDIIGLDPYISGVTTDSITQNGIFDYWDKNQK